jgi:predicted NACHT family NTPase
MEHYYIKEIKKNSQILGDVSAFSRRKELSLEEMYIPLKLKEINLESWAQEKSRVMEAETAVKNYPHPVILGAPGTTKNVEKILETGQGILLLDGLDELTPVTAREKVTGKTV